MQRLVLMVFLLCLLKFQDINTQCCGRVCESNVYQTCGCPATLSGVLCCDSYPSGNAFCNCGTCSSCFRDTKEPCNTCDKKAKAACSCAFPEVVYPLTAIEMNPLFQSNVCESCCCDDKGKNTCTCEGKSIVYFPDVEYPLSNLEVNPFYFTNCWSY